jgi:hypothetical protein
MEAISPAKQYSEGVPILITATAISIWMTEYSILLDHYFLEIFYQAM